MLKRTRRIIKEVFGIIKKPEMKVLPGHLAFFLMLSIVPTITLIGYFATLFGLSTEIIGEFLTNSFSEQTANLLMPIISGKNFDIKIFSIIILGYVIASNGANSIIVVSNTIYNIDNSSYIRRRVKAVFMTTFIVALMIFLIIVPVFGNKIFALIASTYPDISQFKQIFSYLSLPLSFFIVFIFLKIIYTMAPDKKIPSFTVNKGTIFATTMFVIVTEIYTYYAHNLANYDIFYGSLSSIVMVMIWLYFLANTITIGIALNYSSEKDYINNMKSVEKLKNIAEEANKDNT